MLTVSCKVVKISNIFWEHTFSYFGLILAKFYNLSFLSYTLSDIIFWTASSFIVSKDPRITPTYSLVYCVQKLPFSFFTWSLSNAKFNEVHLACLKVLHISLMLKLNGCKTNFLGMFLYLKYLNSNQF